MSEEYKSKKLWDDRFNCKMLSGDVNTIKAINNKIMTNTELNNLEVDIFINVAAPRPDEIAQLQETVKVLKQFRRTVHCHTLMPSTAHATCRLFIDSDRVPSLVSLLENRVDHGIFPDPFCLNLVLDELLEAGQYALAARSAALIMLQEEFGLNRISDILALYSVAKYIESKTDFNDWLEQNAPKDPIFLDPDQPEPAANKTDEQKEEQDAEEDEDDAEYIRIPWLRNPYTDNHFDLDKPRLICGKTLSMVAWQLSPEPANKCQLLGSILQGKWNEANEALNKCIKANTKMGPLKDLSKFYLEELHDIEGPSEDHKRQLIDLIDKLPDGGQNISDDAEQIFTSLKDIETQDIDQLRSSLNEWSELRHKVKTEKENRDARLKLIEEIRAKKEELKAKEQYLYFYDNLKKSNLKRIEYK